MIGRVLANRYEILEVIGSGGMAIVYKARCRLLNRYVAIKVLRPEFKDDKEFIRRFNIESQAAASLSHQNIVSIYDVGQEDDLHYIVMELVEGKTLKEYISENGALYWKEALNFSIQICAALEQAHSKHIIHRDIKPQNMIITNEGVLKVTDFGIARAADSSTTNLGNTALGSAHYISPEQARGGYTDQRSDIYSLGVVMYEMFTGQLPFTGDTPVAVAMQHLQKEPVPPTEINPEVPRSIEKIILKAMCKEQRFRYENVTEMLNDLSKVYFNPEAEVGEIDTKEQFATKKMPAINDINNYAKLPDDFQRSKPKKRRTQKSDKIAIAAAILTSVVLIGILSFAVIKVMWPANTNASGIVPDLLGKTFEEAQSVVANTQFKVIESQRVYNETIPEGQIVSQDPKANEKVSLPHDIYVVVSLGPQMITLKSYVGTDYREAQYDIEKSGLKCIIESEPSDTIPESIVISQSPSANTRLKKGDAVTLYVSTGREEKNIKVPYLIGLTRDEAQKMLEKNGLVLGSTTEQDSDKEKGIVISQSIAPNENADEKTPVDIVISTGKKSSSDVVTPTPSPVLKERHLNLNLPQDRSKVYVKVVGNGKTMYEKMHSTAEKEIDVKLMGNGIVRIQVYYDGNLVMDREENFN